MLTNRPLLPILAVTALIASGQPVDAQAPRALIIDQPEAPVVITKYTARQLGTGKVESGLNYRLEYRNRSERRVEAIEVGIVAFDIWNEYLDKLMATDLDSIGSGKSGDGSWIHDPAAAFLFHTGVAYVSRVRFENGDIWTADLDAVAENIRSVQSGFSAEMLKKKS